MSKSGDLEFDNKEKRNLSGNKSNIKKVILIVVGSVLALLALVVFFVPRFVVYHQAKQVTAELGPAAEIFTDFELVLPDTEAVREVTFDGMTVTIPGYLTDERSVLGYAYMYEEPEEDGKTGGRSVIIATMDVSDTNSYLEEMITEKVDGPLGKYAFKQLMKGYEDLGNGFPENNYTMEKSYYLLKEDDYSFWNWKQGFAYVINGVLKKEASYICDYTYIYEKADICGFIHVDDRTDHAQSDSSEYSYRVTARMYSVNDYSTEHALLIGCDSLETAYAIINSAEIE